MMVIMITAVLVIASALDYRAKSTYLFLVIEMFIMMAFCIYNVDQEAYFNTYNSINCLADVSKTDVAFGFLMLVAKNLGLSYQGFLIAYTAIGLLLFVCVAKRNSLIPGIVIALYFVVNFATITIQIRSFIAESLQLIAMLYLVYKEKPSIIKYVAIVITATVFHNISLFFFLLVMLIITNDRKVINIFTTTVVIGIPAIIVALRYMPDFIVRDKLEQYFVTSKAINITAMVFVAMYIMLTLIVMYIEKKEIDVNGKESILAISLKRLTDIHIIGLISCCLIIIFTPNYYRITRAIIMLDYFVVGNWVYVRLAKSGKSIVYYAVVVTVLFLALELATGSWTTIAANNAILSSIK